MQSAVITQQRRGADHTPSSGPGQADSTALLSGGRCPRGRHLQGSEASGTRGKSRGRWGSGGTCSPGGGRAGQHRRGAGSGGRPWLGRGPARGRRGPPAAAWLSRAPASPSGADVLPSGCRKVLSGWASPDHLAKVPAQSEKAASARKPEDGITWVEPEPNSTERVDPEVSPTHCREQSARRKLAKRVPR